MTALERENAELRAALMIADKRIVKLNFGSREDPALKIIRRVLKESRAASLRRAGRIPGPQPGMGKCSSNVVARSRGRDRPCRIRLILRRRRGRQSETVPRRDE